MNGGLNKAKRFSPSQPPGHISTSAVINDGLLQEQERQGKSQRV